MDNLDFRITEIMRIIERPGVVGWKQENLYYKKDFVIVIALEGEAQYVVGDKYYVFRKNDVLLLAPGSVRSGRADAQNPWGFISVVFRMDMNEEAGSFFNEPIMIWRNVSNVIRQRFIEASYAWTGKNPLYKVKCKNLISEIIYEFVLANPPYHHVPHIKKLEAARTYIQNHFRDEIIMEELAGKLGLSASYFRRLFREAYGCAPMQYLVSLRIDHARDLLETGEVNVTEAARLSGFDDIYYFSKLFKRKVGASPSQVLRKV